MSGQTLRPYQSRALDDLRGEYARGHSRVLLVLPTGGGKTTIAAEMIRSAVARGKRVMFLAHRKELIDQASARLRQFGVDHGVVMASHANWRPWLQVQVASVQTLARRRNSPEIRAPDLLVIDEAHRARAETYADTLRAWPAARVIGLTATPWRADGKGLGDLFESSVVASTPRELTDLGFLVRCDGFSFATADLSGVSTKRGDYDELELAGRMNSLEINGEIVERWQQDASGWSTVAFAVNVKHSLAIVEQFRAAGVAAEHLDGTTPKAEREAILARLASGATTLVSNVGVLTEGWDCPTVSCCILARPTKSVGLYLQMVGRVLRPAPGKLFARIHDHAGALANHGPPDEDRDYSLTADVRKRRAAPGGGPAVAACPQCLRVCLSADVQCLACGHEFPPRQAREIQNVQGGIISLDEVRAMRREKYGDMPIESKAAELKRLQVVAERKGYKPGWAAHQYRNTFGVWPNGIPRDVLASVEPARRPVVPLELLRVGGDS